MNYIIKNYLINKSVFFTSFFLTFIGWIASTDALDSKPENDSYKTPHKIIYMVSPPRSLSVAFTRMMYERGDFEIYHEPSQYAYDLLYYPQFALECFKKDSYSTFRDVKKNLYMSAQTKNVFVKEMSFAVADFLEKDSEFVQNENVYFVFLMRKPHHTTISFYKKRGENDPGLKNLLGYEPLYRIFKKVKSESKNKPIILLTEDLYQRPEETIKALCDHLGIPYIPEALSWSNQGSSFDPVKEWHELKYPQHVQHWHGDAIESEGFFIPQQYAVDGNGKPTFEEISNPAHRECYREAYLHSLLFYDLLLNMR